MPKTSGKRQAEDGRAVQFTTLKVRLYPSPKQAELFEKTFGCCRYIWNQMLSDQQRFYSETGAFFIPTPAKYKPGAPFLKEVDNQALIQEHNKLSQAFRAFFKDPEHFGHRLQSRIHLRPYHLYHKGRHPYDKGRDCPGKVFPPPPGVVEAETDYRR